MTEIKILKPEETKAERDFRDFIAFMRLVSRLSPATRRMNELIGMSPASSGRVKCVAYRSQTADITPAGAGSSSSSET